MNEHRPEEAEPRAADADPAALVGAEEHAAAVREKTQGLVRKVLIGTLLGALVFAGLALYADLPRLRETIAVFEPTAFAIALLLASVNYGLRYARWQYYLRRLGVEVPHGESALVFLSGFVMGVTPGKLGEVFKSLLLYEARGVSIARTAPIVVAERLTDLLALVLLTAAGAHRIITMELHAGQIQGFFNGPVDHLYCSPVIVKYLQDLKLTNPVIVSPDAGGVERARTYAKRLDAALAIVDKRRSGPNVAEVMHLVGDVDGCDAILIDDMIDTAGTICQAAKVLKEYGARRVFAASTHPVLSGPAITRISESVIEEVIVSNTIPLSANGRACPKLKVLTAANIFGEAIKRIHDLSSVSSLFEE